MSKAILLVLAFSTALWASYGLDVDFQKAYNATGSWPVISAALIKTMDKPPFYFSTGVVIRPGDPLGPTTLIDHTEEIRKTNSFFGIFAGSYVAVNAGISAGSGCGVHLQEGRDICNCKW